MYPPLQLRVVSSLLNATPPACTLISRASAIPLVCGLSQTDHRLILVIQQRLFLAEVGLTCFVARWGRTVSMNQALCRTLGAGAFPQASDVAAADPKSLQLEAGLGYRAKSIVQLAQQVHAPFIFVLQLTFVKKGYNSWS